jgi:hypothetical protein
MRRIVLAVALSFAFAGHDPRSAHAETDGLVTREEALRIVETPLEATLGRPEAERVQRVAVANALLEHCGLDWGPLFRLLTAYHRHHQGRPETDMSRITVWHCYWQGQALAMLRKDRPACDEDTRRAAVGNAARHVQNFPQRKGS